MKRTFEVVVSLKEGLLDPQGKAIEGSLPTLGFISVSNVRVGKHIQLTIDVDDEVTALAQLERMAEQLFSNPVIEEFRIIEDATSPSDDGHDEVAR